MFLGPVEDFECLASYEEGKDSGFRGHQPLLRRILKQMHGTDMYINGRNVTYIRVTPGLDLWINVDDQNTTAIQPQASVTHSMAPQPLTALF